MVPIANRYFIKTRKFKEITHRKLSCLVAELVAVESTHVVCSGCIQPYYFILKFAK